MGAASPPALADGSKIALLHGSGPQEAELEDTLGGVLRPRPRRRQGSRRRADEERTPPHSITSSARAFQVGLCMTDLLPPCAYGLSHLEHLATFAKRL